MNMAIFGWLWKRSQGIDDRITNTNECLEDKQDKVHCGATHAAFTEAIKSFESVSMKNGERLAKIETCVTFILKGMEEHREDHKRLTGGS